MAIQITSSLVVLLNKPLAQTWYISKDIPGETCMRASRLERDDITSKSGDFSFVIYFPFQQHLDLALIDCKARLNYKTAYAPSLLTKIIHQIEDLLIPRLSLEYYLFNSVFKTLHCLLISTTSLLQLLDEQYCLIIVTKPEKVLPKFLLLLIH